MVRPSLLVTKLPYLTPFSDFTDDKMQALLAELRASGFEPYSTAIGGSGLGVFHPHVSEDGISAADQTASLVKSFAQIGAPELGAWSEGQGRWLFV
jgi:hypothetical protein